MNKAQADALRKAFPKSSVGQLPKGGVLLDYVGHAVTTDRLLTVDPEWTWEPMAVDEHGNPFPDAAGNLWIRLTVCGVTRIGVGDGNTMKIRIGDAIRNAAMRFGVALDLWTKEELEGEPGEHREPEKKATRVKATPPDDPWLDTPPRDPGERKATQKQHGMMGALMKELGITTRDGALLYVSDVIGHPVESRNDLTVDEAGKVIDALTADKAKP
jgi:hypothetical protein